MYGDQSDELIPLKLISYDHNQITLSFNSNLSSIFASIQNFSSTLSPLRKYHKVLSAIKFQFLNHILKIET